jgi:serine/threonine protein kinase
MTAGVAGDPERRERFLRDARAAVVIAPEHRSAVRNRRGQDQLFLVFEFVPGETLKTAIGGRPLNARRAIDPPSGRRRARRRARRGIVHGDIKPDNIIVTPKGTRRFSTSASAWTAGGAAREHAARAGDPGERDRHSRHGGV